ncbi:MAG: DUF2934 domain-containing protein [Candidatus Omnitrophica bacterium]|nr:DUF2934 domain-containing protein [Candidatus Omnitrophota bacterium]
MTNTFTPEKPAKKRNGAKGNNDRPSSDKIQEEIRKAAYYRFLSRGGQPGNELADWFQAEREVNRRYS